MSPRPTKAQAHAGLAEAILAAAWAQIAQGGRDALNLRAIGRTLRITAPAIYHYYPDRTALMQALRRSHLHGGATQLDQVWQKHGTARAYVGVQAICHEYRRWATGRAQAYMVVFGHDPDDINASESMIALLTPLVQAVEALRQQRHLRIRANLTLTPQGEAELAAWRAHGGAVDATAVATAVVIWSRMHGLMVAELGRDVPQFGVDWASMFRFEVNALMRELFYAPQINTTQTS